MEDSDCAIIGGGIIGSAIAAALAESGKSVTQIDAAQSAFPPATSFSFGWINAHSPHHRHHFQMRLESMKLWRGLKSSYPDLPVYERAAIDWDFDQSGIATLHAAYETAGHSTRVLDKDQLQEEAETIDFPGVRAIVSIHDMVALPEKIAAFFQTLGQSNGVNYCAGAEVIRLHKSDQKFEMITRTQERFRANQVIVAAGCQTANLVKSFTAELPMTERKGLLLTTNPQKPLLKHVISAPDIHCWQRPDGRIIAGQNQAGETRFEQFQSFEQYMITRLRSLLPWLKDVAFENRSMAIRPEPLDAMPVLGPVPGVPGLHVAVLHSGITLAPLIARLICKQVERARVLSALVPYSISRFAPDNERIAS